MGPHRRSAPGSATDVRRRLVSISSKVDETGEIGKPFVFTHACPTSSASPTSAVGGAAGGHTGGFGRLLGCSVAFLAIFGCGRPPEQAPSRPQTAKRFTLTVRSAGDGQGTIAGGPIDCGTRCSGPVSPGQSPVVLTAQPADDSTVSSWSIPGCDRTQCSVTVDRDLTVGVSFARKVPPVPPPATSGTRRITVALEMAGLPFDGSGFTTVSAQGTSLNCPLTCTADLPAGRKLQLDFKTSNPFTPLSHWRLKGWRGPCAAMGDSCTLTLDEDATVTALVEVHPRLVVTVRNPRVAAGRGTVVADRDHVSLTWHDDETGFVLELGESITLTPVPDSNSHFVGWSGPCAAAGTGPCKLTATTNESVGLAVSFDPNVDPRYPLTAIVPLADAVAMRNGKVAGQADAANAARYDLDARTVRKIPLANSIARAVNSRGDVAGESDGHPFVAYATGRTLVLDAINGRATALNDDGIVLGTADNQPSVGRPTFTFDGTDTTWLNATDFWGRALNNFGVIGGCVGAGPYPSGAVFQNGVLSPASPGACVTSTGRGLPSARIGRPRRCAASSSGTGAATTPGP